ncbi:alpha/beta hydrolase [Shewanella waksmanii]|uniref:alpha/beta hydrolase n=1 Tax=Shewanella waksmanii TaxID=213783 RepID=UPI003736C217
MQLTLFKLIIIVLTILSNLLLNPLVQANIAPNKADTKDGTILNAGTLFHHQSKVFASERRFMVSLPERYALYEQRQYPVLYVVDADFQFQHVAAVSYHLARMGKIPPMIVVGIANQGNSDYLYSSTWPVEGEADFGGAARFHQYLANELIPYINNHYRTSDAQALAGYSLGGLFSLYAMMQSNTPFNAFLAMSPSIWVDNYALHNMVAPLLQQQKLTAPLFVSVANEQGMGVDKLIETLEQHAGNLSWQYQQYPNENHFTTALPALYDGLQFLAPNYGSFSDASNLTTLGDYTAVIEHYLQQKQQWAGFEIDWLQAYQFAKYLSWSKQYDQAPQALAKINQHFPNSYTTVCIELAKGAIIREQLPLAEQLLDACQQQGMTRPFWHHQRSKLYDKQANADKASYHAQMAQRLAKQYQLASWEVWELAK